MGFKVEEVWGMNIGDRALHMRRKKKARGKLKERNMYRTLNILLVLVSGIKLCTQWSISFLMRFLC